MDGDSFKQLRILSKALFGNANVLPVAWAVRDAAGSAIRSSLVSEETGGRIAHKDVLIALDRLVAMGALHELPYLGPPQPRVFDRREGAIWEFIVAIVTERVSGAINT